MEIYNLFPGSFASNCYLLIANGHAAVVDPSADARTIHSAVREHGAVLDSILLSHGHFDHICSLDTLRDLSGAPAYLHMGDADMPADSHKNAFYTFFHADKTYRPADKLLSDGDLLELGGETIRVLHTPGHTRGSVCYDCNGAFLVTGDTLFAQGFGRYDLYGGDADQLRRSLQALRAFSGSMTIYPGHGAPGLLGTALDSCAFYL